MNHFAEIDPVTKIVKRVIVAEQDFINSGNLGNPNNWIQTSYNTLEGKHLQGKTPLRKNYAGIGFYYDENLDAFIPPKPFNSWLLNKEKCVYEPPIPKPEDGLYVWNESIKNWDNIALPFNKNN
jgi:hypothetical protein